MTSTSRTAWCECACQVVWKGRGTPQPPLPIKDCALIPVGCPCCLVGSAVLRVDPMDLVLVPAARAGVALGAMELVELEAERPFVAPAIAFGLAAERLRLVCKGWPGARSRGCAVEGGRAGWDAEHPAVPDFPFEVRSVAAAVRGQPVFVPVFARRSGARRRHEVDIDISQCGALVVAPGQDNVDRNTAADMLATGQALELHCGSNDPSLGDVVPIAGPSAGPSAVVCLVASPESTGVARGSSARGCAG